MKSASSTDTTKELPKPIWLEAIPEDMRDMVKLWLLFDRIQYGAIGFLIMWALHFAQKALS